MAPRSLNLSSFSSTSIQVWEPFYLLNAVLKCQPGYHFTKVLRAPFSVQSIPFQEPIYILKALVKWHPDPKANNEKQNFCLRLAFSCTTVTLKVQAAGSIQNAKTNFKKIDFIITIWFLRHYTTHKLIQLNKISVSSSTNCLLHMSITNHPDQRILSYKKCPANL